MSGSFLPGLGRQPKSTRVGGASIVMKSSAFGFLTSKPQGIANRLEHCPLMVGSQDEVPIEEGWRFHNFPTDRGCRTYG